ncbi:MAG TPA: L,D-transpeptidase family protein [Rhizomicrobium sp.]|nr:L,D-transpeptidase family protein [Rhizomicrobium sp.]
MRNLIAALVLTCAAVPAQARNSDENLSTTLESDAGKLKPGQFVWSPELSPSGPMTIVVDLAAQRAHIYRNGEQIGVTTISSGRRGYETPTGVFTILQKAKEHRSRKYDNAPMPYMERLTWGGIALHGGHVHSRPASHGCVRLPMDFSKILYQETNIGMTVIITEGSPSAEAIAEQALPTGSADFRWQPELSPTGPVTVLVNLRNQQVLILRDGLMIGRSQAEIPKNITGDPRALQIVAAGQPETQWFHAGPFNHDAGQAMQVRVPPEFLAKLREAATPGSTMLVVENAVIGGDMPLTVMVSG